MTVSSTYTPDAYTGNNSTTEFPVTFIFFGTTTGAEIEVVQRTIATGAEATLANGTDYTVSGGNGSTGTVTATTAPASTVQLIIRRTTTETQETDYVENDPFPAESHEDALDRLTLIAQEASEADSRTLQFPVSYTGGASNSFPEPSASTVIQWNAAADALESGPTTTEISNAQTNATAAAASAVAAAGSETAAGVSETNAAASAVTAASYSSPVTDLFTAGVDFTAGSSTTITLSGSGLSEDAVMITFDGVVQHHDQYSISGTTVTFTSPIPVGVGFVEAQYATRSIGAIDNVAIGANTPSTGAFTTINGVTPATAQYTTAEETKLSGIETSATADQTGAEIKIAL
jgi:hypothetical protein